MPEEQRRATFEGYAATTPARRVGHPDDVARVILLLVSDTFMTGTIVPCDGGLRLG